MKRCIVPISPEALHTFLQMPEGAAITGCEYDLQRDRILLAVRGMGFDPIDGAPAHHIIPEVHRKTFGAVELDVIVWETES